MNTTTILPVQERTSQTIPNQTSSANSSQEKIEVRYCLYARKSSEDDERQALSIDSQIKEMMQIAEKEGINVVEIRQESHSAKA